MAEANQYRVVKTLRHRGARYAPDAVITLEKRQADLPLRQGKIVLSSEARRAKGGPIQPAAPRKRGRKTSKKQTTPGN